MTLSERIIAEVDKRFALAERTPECYRAFRYPKHISMMRFTVRQYEADFGNLTTMDTVALGGLMRLSTIVFTPSHGQALPVLLIDSMHMGHKSLLYAEYYDTTALGAMLPKMDTQRAEFSFLPDYPEKPAWYVERRMPCSLIKGGKGADGEALCVMAVTCVKRWLITAKVAETDDANLIKLRAFRQDMIARGNPSSATLNRALGEKAAREFFETVIMPIQGGDHS